MPLFERNVGGIVKYDGHWLEKTRVTEIYYQVKKVSEAP